MRVLVTGANGFIGKNLVSTLQTKDNITIDCFTKEDSLNTLYEKLDKADFIFHLAGVNRPKKQEEFLEGNVQLTTQIVEYLLKKNKTIPILLSSSIQAEAETYYGKSKKAAEDIVTKYKTVSQAQVFIYRLPNVFGKWSKPNYNTVVATFCHNIARGIDIEINDSDHELQLVYIDDVVKEFISCLFVDNKKETRVEPIYYIKLGELAKLIYSFKESRNNLSVVDIKNTFIKKLYSTYLSFLPKEDFSYKLTMHKDSRGSFTEFLRTVDRGQVSINISKPGSTKGNHWHHTKCEKFLVVSGEGLIRFRKIDSEEIIEYKVNGENLIVVDVPVGYTHSIVNIGETDLVTVMWVNEPFNPHTPDTTYLEV